MKCWLPVLVLTFFSIHTQGQLCNNNLGDPIVNVTFGHGQDFSPVNTSYSYIGGCPGKGQYTISDFLFGCGGYWVQLTGDHTGDVKGNYMLVDAESTTGTISQETAMNLCGNMTYQYSAYITNVMQDNLTCGATVVLPKLDFTILSLTGTVLATYNTGDIPITNEKLWKQFGFTFTTPPNIDAVILKITTKPDYGCGSAFAIDDIVFQNCGPLVTTTIDGTTDNQNVCADYTNPFVMKGTYSAGFTDPVVQWQSSADSGKTWNDILGEITTTYKVPHRTSGVIEYRMVVAERNNISSANCRIRSNAIYTNIHPVPMHNPPQYINGCTGRDYHLPQSDPTALNIMWTGPKGYQSTDPKSVIPNLQYADTGLYKLMQGFYFGCTSIDSFYLKVAPGITISTQPAHPVCIGQGETLSATASSTGSFKWTPSVGLSADNIANPVATPKDSTVYKVIVTNASGCQDSATLTIPVYIPPVATAGIDKLIVSGDTATLEGMVTGTAINYSWSPPVSINDIHAMHPKVSPTKDITYTLNAVSTVGCGSSADEVNVKVYDDFYIPNSFTPNYDGVNDVFHIKAYDNYKVIKFLIYDRFGNLVFSSTDFNKGWDGTYKGQLQSVGVYIYYLELLNPKGKHTIKRGTINLLR